MSKLIVLFEWSRACLIGKTMSSYALDSRIRLRVFLFLQQEEQDWKLGPNLLWQNHGKSLLHSQQIKGTICRIWRLIRRIMLSREVGYILLFVKWLHFSISLFCYLPWRKNSCTPAEQGVMRKGAGEIWSFSPVDKKEGFLQTTPFSAVS